MKPFLGVVLRCLVLLTALHAHAADLSRGRPVIPTGVGDCNDNQIPDATETALEIVANTITTDVFNARSVFTADLDGDGDPDVLSASWDDKIAWYRNLDGAATFGPQLIISTVTDPEFVTAADVDGDGDLDVLATTTYSNQILWLENTDGMGTFGPEQMILHSTSDSRILAVGDLDADGDVDLVAPSHYSTWVVGFLNIDGLGGFGLPQIVSDDHAAFDVVMADIDGDDDLDLVAIYRNHVAWHENTDGLGSFGPGQTITSLISTGWTVAAGDVDGDGDVDVFSGSRHLDTISWYENLDGAGDFGAQLVIDDSGPHLNPADMHVSDFDGDGDIDLILANSFKIDWYENTDGAGTFVKTLLAISPSLMRSITTQDLDADGDVDILVATSTSVTWWENGSSDCNGNGLPDECDVGGVSADCNSNDVPDECDIANRTEGDCDESQIPDSCEGGADCNADGVPDACDPDCNTNSVSDVCDVNTGFSDDCNGNAIPDECEPDCNANAVPDACDIIIATSPDCDGNGIPDECQPDDCNWNSTPDACDIASGNSSDSDDNGVPDECDPDCDDNGASDSFALSYTRQTADLASLTSAALADLDADGDLDIVGAVTDDSTVSWYENTDGLGSFGARQVISSAVDGPISVYVADMDGDLDPDVLSSSSNDNKVAWYENLDGLGSFGPQSVIATGAGSPVVAIDVDGDKDMDVVSAFGASVVWYENLDGQGTFGTAQIIAAAPVAPSTILVADVTGDLADDLFVITDTLRWYENTGGGLGNEQQIDNVNVVFLADVDGDGDLDIVAGAPGGASVGDDYVKWLENLDGQGLFGPPHVLSFHEQVDTVTAHDLDGDGDQDVLSWSSGNNQLSWHENLGAGVFQLPLPIDSTVADAPPTMVADLDGDGSVDVLHGTIGELFWYRNESNDCDANSVPNPCESDCNLNGVPDDCDDEPVLDVCTPPDAPLILEPEFDGLVVSHGDVHMVTDEFSDPDPGDAHLCTDWEIWNLSPPERVWFAACATSLSAVHIHLGDGTFENSLAGFSEVEPGTDYRLQVRHRDDRGDPGSEWSDWSERLFSTAPVTQPFPLLMDDVVSSPPPTWVDGAGAPIILPPGSPAPLLRMESPDDDLLLEIRGFDGVTNATTNPDHLEEHLPLKIRVKAGDPGGHLVLPESDLTVTDDELETHTILLPAIDLAPSEELIFWVDTDGNTYEGAVEQTEPDLSQLARGSDLPWTVLDPRFELEVVARGLRMPVSIAFVPNPGNGPMDPLYYVTELYGNIKVVTRDGHISEYAEDLLDFEPTGLFPGSGESGLTGTVVDPETGDVFASLIYGTPLPQRYHAKTIRFSSLDGGLTAATMITVFDMGVDLVGVSHQISATTIGPDQKLYIHVGDGFAAPLAQDLDSSHGKVFRVNLDGSVPTDNPFYDAGDGITTRDRLFAIGLRNPFGAAWRAEDGHLYSVENGTGVDRIIKIESGENYLWDGTTESLLARARYVWDPSHAPVNIDFIQTESSCGGGFPEDKFGYGYVSEHGATYQSGPNPRGKRISEFVFDENGDVIGDPIGIVEYTGTGKATTAALAVGPDGLYFSDFFKDQNYNGPTDSGARILRLRAVNPTPVGLTVERGEIDWNSLASSSGYDLVRGDLNLLLSTGGDFSQATTDCLAANSQLLQYTEIDVPVSGNGFWYLLRYRLDDSPACYESNGIGQYGVRDPGIAAAAQVCP